MQQQIIDLTYEAQPLPPVKILL